MGRAYHPFDITGKDIDVFRLMRWLLTFAAALFVLNLFHISPKDLWWMAAGKAENFRQDTLDMASGKATDDIAQKARAETREFQNANPAGNNEMSRELQAERARILEAKFNALQDQKLNPTEKSRMSEQLVRSAEQAAGSR